MLAYFLSKCITFRPGPAVGVLSLFKREGNNLLRLVVLFYAVSGLVFTSSCSLTTRATASSVVLILQKHGNKGQNNPGIDINALVFQS